MKRTAPILALLLAACGAPQDHPRCESDAACAAGQVCERSGGDGVCVTAYRLALTAPAAGTWVGGSVDVSATVEVLLASRAAPASIELLAGGQPAATLARDPSSGAYQGSWSPGAGTAGAVVLEAVAARGTHAEQRSASRTVQVDLGPPVLSAVAAACTGGCRRDGRLRVTATVTEPNVSAVTATLDLDAARSVALARQGATDQFAADVELGSYPFPHFERAVQVAVRAADQAGHQASAVASTQVTRMRWVYAAGAPVTSPAVMADGTLVAGVSATSEQLRAVNPEGTEAWRLTIGSSFITAAPSAGAAAIWVGSEDGRMYGRLGNGSTIRYPTAEPLPAATLFTPAVDGADVAHSTSSARRLYAAKADGSLGASSPLGDAFSGSAVVDQSGKLRAATRTATDTAAVRAFTFDGAAYTQDWSTTPTEASTDCTRIDAPLAIDAAGNAIAACGNGQIFRLSPAGAATFLVRLTGKADGSIAVRSDGDLVVGTNDNLLHRLTPAAGGGHEERWTGAVDLGAGVTGVALTARDASGVDLLAVTSGGGLYAVDGETGAVIWSTDGMSPPPLGVAALRFPTVAPALAGKLPTAHFGSADGNLYAVVVDGALDAAAPWPKAHHDVRNTGNAGSPLP
ncbi:MAG: PQQ-binding-like beta-propeller repeat protein [Deltaproteobacteria bacterium]|nr:PQQ-binding-like beta-propeller repeat protein [Deltaproteobacteria bacterium]